MILTTAVAVVVVAGGFWMLGGPEGKSTVDFSTETVTKGNVSNFITATGTIEPVTEVEVGTQVSGIIDKILCGLQFCGKERRIDSRDG